MAKVVDDFAATLIRIWVTLRSDNNFYKPSCCLLSADKSNVRKREENMRFMNNKDA